MSISFIIPTCDGWDRQPTRKFLKKLVNSIEQVPKKEIILIGNANGDLGDVFIETDANISCKINAGVKAAKYDKLVFMRDYHVLDEHWWYYWSKNMNGWDLAMNVVLNADNNRFRDVCFWSNPKYGRPWVQYDKPFPDGKGWGGQPCLAPYDVPEDEKKYLYISGAYWLSTKDFMSRFPLDERYGLGEAEDVEWASRWTQSDFRFFVNKNAIVRMQKYKDVILPHYMDLI